MSNKVKEDQLVEGVGNKDPKKCGIVMPIASMEGYPESHWKDVKRILSSAIDDAGFEARIVSEADDIGVIHQRIVQNLYDNPMIVCDISGRNPNVMFELGLRLAFDKPTIIVKDDITQYSFDTSVIQHLTYPKDLRYHDIENFKRELKEKIENTSAIYEKDPSNYSTFLKNFGSFKVPQIDEKTLPVNEYIIEELRQIRGDLSEINLINRDARNTSYHKSPPTYDANIFKKFSTAIVIVHDNILHINKILENIGKLQEVKAVKIVDTKHINITFEKSLTIPQASNLFEDAGFKFSFETHFNDRILYSY